MPSRKSRLSGIWCTILKANSKKQHKLHEEKRDLSELQQTLGYTFRDSDLLELALTHPSYAMLHGCQDNQRLEFLGDAVLQIRTSDVLYHRFSNLHEGQMTRRRSALVCEANLAKAARRLMLGRWLRLAPGEVALGGEDKASILSDAMEAVIAAVYLDGGFEAVFPFIDRVLQEYEAGEVDVRDAKSRLQEYVQARGEPTPVYEEVGMEGPANARVFTARVLRGDGTELGRGRGTRKQWAEEAAAEAALKLLEEQEQVQGGSQLCG